MIPQVGDRFRHFRVLGRAGEGGMGVVFHAEDTRLGREVALKFLTCFGAVDEVEAERMRREARAIAALNHVNIVTLYDMDEVEGAPYLVLEWLPGTTLARVTRPLPLEEFLRVALPVAEALAAAHSRGIVHRDVKPGNVLLGADGSVKLVDFGLARTRDAQVPLTRTATLQGTVAYMSPEQAAGGQVGPPSDVFSFGVLAYELLTGQLPFPGDSFPAALYATLHLPHVPLATRRPDLPGLVTTLVERCLQKRPEARFANGAELAQVLHHIVRGRAANEAPQRSAAAVPAASAPPEVRYCHTADGAAIAYAVNGSGPVLVRVLGWFTHLEMEWEWPALRLIWERLGATHTVVRYDGRGIGLSSPWPGEFTEETRQLDLDAVLNAIGAEQVVLYGISEGGWTAAWYAHDHPGRVSHLVLYGAYARGARFRGSYDAEEQQAIWTLMRKGWGRDTPEIRQIFTTAYFGPEADPGLVAHFNQLQRASADPETAVRYDESLSKRDDAREAFGRIRRPTLVIHCRDDKIIAFEEGRRLAAAIPGARLLPLPTGTHYFPVDDDVTYKVAEAINRFTLPSAEPPGTG